MLSMHSTAARGPHMRQIIFHCLLVTTPMLASSIALLWIVYAHLIEASCPSQELCPGPDLVNATTKDHYYVDFPAARLAFVSSWSSTISFALVGFLMAMYAYPNAASLLRASEKANHESLPSPHDMSVLLRLLNAELLTLWVLAASKVKRVFWNRVEEADASQRARPILATSVRILMGGIIASLLVQAADVYLHITAEAVNLIQVQGLPSAGHEFSRGLAPWCLDRPTLGLMGQKNFFGCAITAQPAPYNNATTLAPTNATIIQDLKNSNSDQHTILNFTDSNEVQYAIVGPANIDASVDWKANSMGVSTTCTAIPQDACDMFQPMTNAKDASGSPVLLVPFVCTRNRSGIDISGNLTSHNTKVHMLDFHKYAVESVPFLNNTIHYTEDFDTILQKLKTEDANSILKNAWGALVMRKIPSAVQGDFSQLAPSFRNDTRIWKSDLLGAFTLLLCNVTVWDATYTSSGRQVTGLTKTQSNGSTAGIASMPGTRFIGTLTNIFQDESTGPFSRSSPSNFIRSFELGMSKAYSYPLASQMSSRPSLLVQTRTSKVVTRLPVAALWFVVGSNLIYALLGFSLAFWALWCTTPEVHQVQVRLGVAGLAAALFDRAHFERSAATDDGLFEENSKEAATAPKRIGVKRTATGGSSFALYH